MKKGSIFAKSDAGITTVRVLIREFADGNAVGGAYIKQVSCAHNGKALMEAELNESMKAEPYFSFAFKGGAPGEEIQLSWADSKGKQGTHKTVIG